MMEDDDDEIPGPESLHIVHSCQSDQPEMAEDDVLNPRPAVAAVERDDGRFRGASRMLIVGDEQEKCCCCGIITKRRLSVASVLAFGQGIALIATCMNAASFTLSHRFNVHTQVSSTSGDWSSLSKLSLHTRPFLPVFSALLDVHIPIISFAPRAVR
jgi:hypothetical protein